ncbi:FliM/FliN family flagellar motor switch protein [Qipengyuania sp. ASV99]|uniref:FliM/FliN family flagellar motor switch protein n=1 Tax=Qipengyuania sp. ASV99 TaxID=3399681 RepID=UPI003A4C6625
MSPQFASSFADARPLAQHCAELTARSGPRPEERAEDLAVWCRDLGRELAQEFGQILSGGKLKVTVAMPEIMLGSAVFERIGPVAANSLLRCGDAGQTMLFSVDIATVIALTDYSFGGDGTLPDTLPPQLPRSAAMLAEQMAGLVAQVIAVANGAADRSSGDVLVRSESVTRLKPFDPAAEVALLTVTMVMDTGTQWSAVLAVAADRLDALLPGAGSAQAMRGNTAARSNASDGAFDAVPLPLEAVLSQFTMSLGQLERLAPGDEIPLAIPRELPLKVGEETLAHGTLGTLENRMALRITRLPGQIRETQFNENFGAAA